MANINKVNVNGTVYNIEDAAVRSSVAASYSASSAYAVGDYCLHDGQLYKCNTAIPSSGEAWNANHWTAADVMSEVKDIAANSADPYLVFSMSTTRFGFVNFTTVPTTYSALIASNEFKRALSSPIIIDSNLSGAPSGFVAHASLYNGQGLGDPDGNKWTILFADAIDMGSAGSSNYINGVKGIMTYDTTNSVWYLASVSYNIPASRAIASDVVTAELGGVSLDVTNDASKTITGTSTSGGGLTLTTSDIAIDSDQVTMGNSVTAASSDEIAIFDASNSNKLSGSGLTFDANGSSNYLSQAGTWEVVPTVTVDSTLSTTSENPVQNKVINTALADKEAKGKITVSNTEYTVTRKALVITDSLGTTTTYYVADITS